MAQGRSTKIISMIKWIQTGRFSIKNSHALSRQAKDLVEGKKLLEEDRSALLNAATHGDVTKVPVLCVPYSLDSG